MRCLLSYLAHGGSWGGKELRTMAHLIQFMTSVTAAISMYCLHFFLTLSPNPWVFKVVGVFMPGFLEDLHIFWGRGYGCVCGCWQWKMGRAELSSAQAIWDASHLKHRSLTGASVSHCLRFVFSWCGAAGHLIKIQYHFVFWEEKKEHRREDDTWGVLVHRASCSVGGQSWFAYS